MATGTVKWFNDAKGFGFIEPDGGGPDIFAHFSAIAMEGFKTLKQGARVSFEVTQGPKGQLAQNIHAEHGASGDRLDLPLPGHRNQGQPQVAGAWSAHWRADLPEPTDCAPLAPISRLSPPAHGSHRSRLIPASPGSRAVLLMARACHPTRPQPGSATCETWPAPGSRPANLVPASPAESVTDSPKQRPPTGAAFP